MKRHYFHCDTLGCDINMRVDKFLNLIEESISYPYEVDKAFLWDMTKQSYNFWYSYCQSMDKNHKVVKEEALLKGRHVLHKVLEEFTKDIKKEDFL